MAYGSQTVAMALLLGMILLSPPARAQEVRIDGCVGTWFSSNCVTRWGPANDPFIRLVPQTLDSAQRARMRERDRRWAARCHPAIRQDRYGVSRYVYTMPGCEFGVSAF